MKLRMYAILDKAVGAYMPPLAFRAAGEATRSFIDSLRSTPQIANNATDYAFCHVGFYDDSLGQLEPLPGGPVVVMEAAVAVSELQNKPAVSGQG